MEFYVSPVTLEALTQRAFTRSVLLFFFWTSIFLVEAIQKSGCEEVSADKWCHRLDAGSTNAKGFGGVLGNCV